MGQDTFKALSASQRIRTYYSEWMIIYQSIHGPMSKEEVEAVNSLVEFLMGMVQAEKGITG